MEVGNGLLGVYIHNMKDSAGKTAAPTAILRKDMTSPEGVQAPNALHDREKHGWQLTISKEQLAKIAGTKNVNAVDLFLAPFRLGGVLCRGRDSL